MQKFWEKVVQKEGTASAKVLGQRYIGEFEIAQSQHDLCGRREGLMGRGAGRSEESRGCYMQRLEGHAKNFNLYCK